KAIAPNANSVFTDGGEPVGIFTGFHTTSTASLRGEVYVNASDPTTVWVVTTAFAQDTVNHPRNALASDNRQMGNVVLQYNLDFVVPIEGWSSGPLISTNHLDKVVTSWSGYHSSDSSWSVTS